MAEDYVFNRQTEIDDADDIESKMNTARQEAGGKSSKEEIVNDSNATNLQVKKLSTYPSDVVGASTSGPDKRNRVTPTKAASPTSSATKMTSTSADFIDENSSTSSNASRAGPTDEDDNEIIEKFLEQLNINVNTELILAKRRTLYIRPPSNSYFSLVDTPPPPSPTNSTSTDSGDYNTLQKMDYYLLYDVWYVTIFVL